MKCKLATNWLNHDFWALQETLSVVSSMVCGPIYIRPLGDTIDNLGYVFPVTPQKPWFNVYMYGTIFQVYLEDNQMQCSMSSNFILYMDN